MPAGKRKNRFRFSQYGILRENGRAKLAELCEFAAESQ